MSEPVIKSPEDVFKAKKESFKPNILKREQ
jgi:hypothetical protein